ncbi:MAG TPA: inorganic phosphate transporter [Clostridiales bacterium]|nr:inorganic phosphate transporter [Clostridiales bacterium]
MFSISLLIVIVTALVFEFINGFHDTANAIATSVYTRAISPGKAIMLAAVMNFIGALASEKVAMTISKGLILEEPAQYVILAALIGAIVWNLITWYIGMPNSSSHALIGSLVGAVIIENGGFGNILWSGLFQKVVIPLVTSPIVGFFVGFLVMKWLYILLRNKTPFWVNHTFSKLQVVSAAVVSYSHGNNDAQKTMGIITLALIGAGLLEGDAGVPLWVKIVCAIMIALGTSVGGWRIMRTMGSKVTRLAPSGGFVAQTAAAAVIESMTALGAPVSTTQVITSSIMGVGSSKRLSSVNWGVAQSIVAAWFITLPITMILGGTACFLLSFLF